MRAHHRRCTHRRKISHLKEFYRGEFLSLHLNVIRVPMFLYLKGFFI